MIFGHAERRLDQKDGTVNSKIYDVTDWTANNYNTHADNNFWSVEIFFLKNHTKNVVEKLVPDPFVKSQN